MRNEDLEEWRKWIEETGQYGIKSEAEKDYEEEKDAYNFKIDSSAYKYFL